MSLENPFANPEPLDPPPSRKKRDSLFRNKQDWEIVASLAPKFERLIEQLHLHIDQGDYDLLIGDDASGRIPTLIMHEFLSAIYDEQKLTHPKTLFIAGSRRLTGRARQEKTQEIETLLQQTIAAFPDRISKRVLIMTDTVETGDSLEPLCLILKKIGIPYDIATLALLGQSDERQGRLGTTIIHADEFAPFIFGQEDLSGVSKENDELFARPVRKVAESKATARAASRAVSKHLVEWYLENHPKTISL